LCDTWTKPLKTKKTGTVPGNPRLRVYLEIPRPVDIIIQFKKRRWDEIIGRIERRRLHREFWEETARKALQYMAG
jgi:hypothetical protein